MKIYLVTLDGGEDHPERSCELSVAAQSEHEARAHAEKQNPGIAAVSAKLLK